MKCGICDCEATHKVWKYAFCKSHYEDLEKHDKVNELLPVNQTTVNFTNSMWGHACSIDTNKDGILYAISGHSIERMNIGDHVIFKSGSNNLFGFRMKIISIEWCSDPRDMFFAKCVFANTQSPEDIECDSAHIKNNDISWNTATKTSFTDIEKVIQKHIDPKFKLSGVKL